MNTFGTLQLLGGIILSTGYIPQIAQILRTHKVDDINLWFFVQVVLGVCCMEAYALHLYATTGQWFFLATNTTSLILSSTVVALKLRYGRKDMRRDVCGCMISSQRLPDHRGSKVSECIDPTKGVKTLDWYSTLEPGVRDVVRLLRDNGFNTTCSCEHGRYVEMEWYADEDVTRLYNLLVENGHHDFTLECGWQMHRTFQRRSMRVVFERLAKG
jgi:MtN3 and saliva related transmembrane protein